MRRAIRIAVGIHADPADYQRCWSVKRLHLYINLILRGEMYMNSGSQQRITKTRNIKKAACLLNANGFIQYPCLLGLNRVRADATGCILCCFFANRLNRRAVSFAFQSQLYVFFITEDYFLILDKSREAAYNHAHASDANEARCKSVGEEMQAMKHTCLRRSSKGYLKVLSVPPYRMCR